MTAAETVTNPDSIAGRRGNLSAGIFWRRARQSVGAGERRAGGLHVASLLRECRSAAAAWTGKKDNAYADLCCRPWLPGQQYFIQHELNPA